MYPTDQLEVGVKICLLTPLKNWFPSPSKQRLSLCLHTDYTTGPSEFQNADTHLVFTVNSVVSVVYPISRKNLKKNNLHVIYIFQNVKKFSLRMFYSITLQGPSSV